MGSVGSVGSVGRVDRGRAIRIPRREFVVLKAYIELGSHKAAAHALGIAESTGRQRMSGLHRRIGARTMAQTVWLLRHQLEQEGLRVQDREQG